MIGNVRCGVRTRKQPSSRADALRQVAQLREVEKMVAAMQSQLRPILHGPRTMEEGGQRITPPQRASAHGQSQIQKSWAAESPKNTPRATKMETVVQRGAYVDKKPTARTGPEEFRGTDREGEPAASRPPRLDTTWQVWQDANGATDAEFSDVTKFATFSDLVGFSTVWRPLLAQAQALGGRVGIFRQGVTPSIADPRHVDGGRWVATTLPAAQRNVLWSLLVTGVVTGGCVGPGGTEVVTGLVLHMGERRDRVEVWVGGGDNHNKGKGALSLATTTVPVMVCLHGRLFPKESPTRFVFESSAVQKQKRERAAGFPGFRWKSRQRRKRMPLACPARWPVGCSRPTGPTDRLHPTASAPPGCSFMAARHDHIDPPRAMTPQPPPPAAPQSMGPAHPFSNPPYARPPSMCPPPPSAVFVHSPYATPAAGLVRSC